MIINLDNSDFNTAIKNYISTNIYIPEHKDMVLEVIGNPVVNVIITDKVKKEVTLEVVTTEPVTSQDTLPFKTEKPVGVKPSSIFSGLTNPSNKKEE